MNQEKIGKFIKDLRTNKGLTQQEFASSLGVTYQAVSKWENGKNMPDIQILKMISEKYDVNIDELLDGQKSKKNKSLNNIIYVLLGWVLIFGAAFFLIKINNKEYKFKDVVSTCEEYKISGVAAYDKNKSSLYISDVEYCGEKNETIYESITCTLYEEYNGEKKEISKCEEREKESLDEYLKTINIKVTDYSSVCKNFNDIKLFLEITATGKEEYKHEIPLKVNTCD